MAGRIGLRLIAALAAMMLAVPASAGDGQMLVIAHRGASGERPEHTLASYELAIAQGADFIEPDLVSTKDGVLVARHENEIGGTTNVADRPEFADRKTARTIDGMEFTGWFTEDFTLAELKTLRAKERVPQLRPQNTAYDGLYEVPTLAEIIALVKASEAQSGRRIGLYPELKHPSYFAALGLPLEGRLLDELAAAGYSSASDPVFIQSFEVGVLERLAEVTQLRLIQLVAGESGPADRPETTYAAMVTPEGLARMAQYASGIGAELRMVLGPDGSATPLTANAHAAGLQLHGWTLRRENAFLPPALRLGEDPAAQGNLAALVALLKAAGVDGVFTDNPADMIAAIRQP